MKLLVDSGSTKADWIAIDNSGKVLFSTQTAGLNPEILMQEELLKRVRDNIDISSSQNQVSHLFFYGAGCGTNRMKSFLKEVFQSYFENAQIVIHEDTYAAVYATTPVGEKAIVCILGTGSNCSYYDGVQLQQKVQSLGYIAMDDCSGNRFGRHMLRAFYFNKMPKELAQEFAETYNMDPDVVKQNLYKEANPNAYLATFAEFFIKYKDHSFCQPFIDEEIEVFIENYIKQFDNYKEMPVHFIGSIAFYLKAELESALKKHSIQIGKILRRPIDGLINYHISNN